MQNHKYLTDAGLKKEEIMQNLCGDDDPRRCDWEEEREIYGFDNRETWSLDSAFVQWLYERLMGIRNYLWFLDDTKDITNC